MSDPGARKRALRAAALAADREPAPSSGLAAQELLLATPELLRAGTVSLYAARAPEVPTNRLAQELAVRGARVVFPRVSGRELALHFVVGAQELRSGYRGLLEPAPEARVCPPEAVDVFIVPGLRFDRRGRRLGRGGGHYDRLLARARSDALRIGLCYAEHVIDELPACDWDVTMHRLVTEAGVHRFSEPA